MTKARHSRSDASVKGYCRGISEERESWIHHRTWAISGLLYDLRKGPVNKKNFKSDIENVLTDPFSQWIYRIVMTTNGVQPDEFRRNLWKQSEDKVEYEFTLRFLQPIDGTFDRTRATLQALRSLRKDEPHNHNVALQLLNKEHHLVEALVPLPREKVEEFFDWIEEVMRVATFNQECIESSRLRYEKRYGRKRAKGSTHSTRKKS